MTPEEPQDQVEEHVEAEGGLEPDEEFVSVEEEEKTDWENAGDDADTDAQGGVMIGLTALGPVVQVTSPNGEVAQKVVSIDELFQLGGQAIGIASFVMQMSMQAQMQEQARIQEMMARGEEQTASGLYVKKR